MHGGPPVPGDGAGIVMQGGGRAPGPIGGARLAHGRDHAVIHAHEVAKGGLRALDEAQRQPSREPFGLGIVAAVLLAVAAGEPIGLVEIPWASIARRM